MRLGVYVCVRKSFCCVASVLRVFFYGVSVKMQGNSLGWKHFSRYINKYCKNMMKYKSKYSMLSFSIRQHIFCDPYCVYRHIGG